MCNSRIVIAFLLMLEAAIPSSATNLSVTQPQAAHLGKVHFANSCSSQVQVEFNSAVAMLHSFQYGLAEKTFNHVLKRDPQCAIAYWGAAMTLYHRSGTRRGGNAQARVVDYLEKARGCERAHANLPTSTPPRHFTNQKSSCGTSHEFEHIPMQCCICISAILKITMPRPSMPFPCSHCHPVMAT